MKKFVLAVCILFAFINYVNGQIIPQVDISLNVTDGFASKELKYGLDPTATDGIDPALDETEQPPSPPTGVFDARFIGDDIGITTMGQGLVKDYRFGYDTTRGQRIQETKSS